jgi:hypothetical protein
LPEAPSSLSPKERRFGVVNPIIQPIPDRHSSRTSSTCDTPYSIPKFAFFDPNFHLNDPPKGKARQFIDTPPENLSEAPWPLTGNNTATSSPWPTMEKPLPPTPRASVSTTSTRRGLLEEYSHRLSDSMRSERPASWQPRPDAEPLSFNFDKAILGTSLARDHRLRRREDYEENNLESSFNNLRLSSERSSMASFQNGFRNYTWFANDDGGNDVRSSRSSNPEMRPRSILNRIISERNLNPTHFDITPKYARYFVLKSYNVYLLKRD